MTTPLKSVPTFSTISQSRSPNRVLPRRRLMRNRHPLSTYTCADHFKSGRISAPTSNSLDFGQLANFEQVTHQYKKTQGVIFNNAIAIQPSNPAFITTSDNQADQMILMGGPKAGMIEVQFIQPVRSVRGWITSSRSMLMTAFDRNHQVLDQDETSGSNLADDPNAVAEPQHCLSLEFHQAVIYRIVLYCSGGQLALSHFRFAA